MDGDPTTREEKSDWKWTRKNVCEEKENNLAYKISFDNVAFSFVGSRISLFRYTHTNEKSERLPRPRERT